MAFSDVEMAILSQLAYCGSTNENKTIAPFEGDSLYNFIIDNKAWLEKN